MLRLLRRVVALCVIATASLSLSAQQSTDVAAEQAQSKLRFAWGAEAGSSIDMGGHDMSSVDFNASFGMSRGFIKFLGIGAGANIMVSNSCRTYPVYINFRTDFNKRLRLLFADIRGGMALNYLDNNQSQVAPYGAAGVGINLATGLKFRSYLWAGYTLIWRNDIVEGDAVTPYEPLHMASIRLGVSF